jgi:hypothetical protein
MKKAPHLEPLTQYAEHVYQSLLKDWTKRDLDIFCSGSGGLRDIISSGSLPAFLDWLDTPTPDWQADC